MPTQPIPPTHNQILTQAIANSPPASQRYIAELEAENERMRAALKSAIRTAEYLIEEEYPAGSSMAAERMAWLDGPRAALAERHGGEDQEIAGEAERKEQA